MTASQKRPVNGILLLDKPSGLSSNKILQQIKRFYRAEKAGHTGTLDPLASGLLPICFGEATKFSRYLLAEDKTYRVKAKLGIRTATGDSEGEVLATRFVPLFTKAELETALNNFRGAITQVPSMYSALKYQGQPLYKLARQGIEVARAERAITIYEINLIDYQDEILEFQVHCSKGTYVRTLVDDLGELLGCGAHVTYLHRISVGRFNADAMHTLEKILAAAHPDELLLPIAIAVADLPVLQVDEKEAHALRLGQSINKSTVSAELVAVFVAEQLQGVAEVTPEGKVCPRRWLCHLNY